MATNRIGRRVANPERPASTPAHFPSGQISRTVLLATPSASRTEPPNSATAQAAINERPHTVAVANHDAGCNPSIRPPKVSKPVRSLANATPGCLLESRAYRRQSCPSATKDINTPLNTGAHPCTPNPAKTAQTPKAHAEAKTGVIRSTHAKGMCRAPTTRSVTNAVFKKIARCSPTPIVTISCNIEKTRNSSAGAVRAVIISNIADVAARTAVSEATKIDGGTRWYHSRNLVAITTEDLGNA